MLLAFRWTFLGVYGVYPSVRGCIELIFKYLFIIFNKYVFLTLYVEANKFVFPVAP